MKIFIYKFIYIYTDKCGYLYISKKISCRNLLNFNNLNFYNFDLISLFLNFLQTHYFH